MPIDTDVCNEVVDSTNSSTITPKLQTAIEALKKQGIEPRILIVRNGETLGVSNQDELEEFVANLAHRCGTDDNYSFVVALSLREPRTASLHLGEVVDNTYSMDDYYSQAQEYKREVNGDAEPYQDDIANMILRLTDLSRATEQTGPTASTQEVKPLNIPFAKIGIGSGISLLTIGVGARITQGVRLRNKVKGIYRDISKAKSDLVDVIIAGESELSNLPEEDAKDLRSVLSRIQQLNLDLETMAGDISSVNRNLRKKIMPRISELSSIERKAKSLLEDTRSNIDKATSSIAELSELKISIDKRIADFDHLVDECISAMTAKQADGWDLSAYSDLLDQFKQRKNDIAQLRSEGFVDKPAEVIDEIDGPVVELTQKITDLDQTLETTTARYESLNESINQAEALLAKTTATYEFLSTTYNANDVADIVNNVSKIKERVDSIKEEQQLQSNYVGRKSATDIENIIKSQGVCDGYIYQIEALARAVEERKTTLGKLLTEIPSRALELKTSISESIDYARNHSRDVEEDTMQLLIRVQEAMSETSATIAGTNPSLLQVDESLIEHSQKLDEAKAKVQNDIDEMVELRETVSRLTRELESDARRTLDFATTNSGVETLTEQDAREIEIPRYDEDATREELKARKEELEILDDRIGKIRCDAEQQHQMHMNRMTSSSTAYSTGSITIGGFDSGSGGGSTGSISM